MLLFAALRERRGAPRVDLDLPPGSPVESVFPALFPEEAGTGWPGPLLYVVGREYVPEGHPLREGDEVALIPPLGGG